MDQLRWKVAIDACSDCVAPIEHHSGRAGQVLTMEPWYPLREVWVPVQAYEESAFMREGW